MFRLSIQFCDRASQKKGIAIAELHRDGDGRGLRLLNNLRRSLGLNQDGDDRGLRSVKLGGVPT